MKIFLSWSGPTSKAVAEALRDWLPLVIQAVRPYLSSADIDKGARWLSSIAEELEATKVGLICLTPNNLDAPWIHFEAGALSKTLDKTYVCPYLFGLEPTDVTGPLKHFQATRAQRDDTRSLIKTINKALGNNALPENTLDKLFNKWWPDLDKDLKNISLDNSSVESKPQRSDSDLLAEVLELVRGISDAIFNLQPLTSRRPISGSYRTLTSLSEMPIDTDILLQLGNVSLDEATRQSIREMLNRRLERQESDSDTADNDDDTPETPSS
jgi:hypothetical protein